VKIINHVLNLEIDKFKLEYGRQPSVMRLGRKQVASLLDVEEGWEEQMSCRMNYRDIPIEVVDEDWHLGIA
jgi:hypothetical protein